VLTQSTPIDGTRFAGILFNTYIIYEAQSEIILVDQHAAHERIRYEKLKKRMIGSSENPAPLSSQSLLIPETVRFPNEDRTTLENRLSWLSSLGFEAEIFGEDTLLFRAVPGEWGDRQLKPRLKNLVERVLSVDAPENSVILDETLFEALASEACHSAIRAGDHLEPDEVADLIRQLFECEHPWNCPHGRPTVVRVPQGKLEEWFQRRV
jgi:DNA mismatch repair protein MutL